MRTTIGISAILSIGFACSAAGLHAASGASWQERLAALDYEIGAEASEVADYRIKERIYLDSRHVMIPGDAPLPYLVTLQESCFGLQSNRIIPRTHTWHVLAPGDILVPTHEGRSVDECVIERIEELQAK